jgi:glycosyltransferase involved in cell wall biosynthesis
MSATRRPLRACMVHYSDFRVDSRIQRLARALAERGDTVHVVGVGEDDRLRVGDGEIRVHALSAAKRGGGAKDTLRGYAGFLAGATRRVTQLHLRQRLDVVEAHNMPDALVAAALVPRLAGVPLILNLHDTFPELYATTIGRRGARLVGLEERASAAMATAVIAVTDEARALLAARGIGRGRIEVVMNLPDEAVFGPRRPPVRPPEHGPIRVLYHGGLPERFGVGALIEAFGQLGDRAPRAELRVLGSGPQRDALAALARAVAPDRVEVAAAPVPFAEIPSELAGAHIGVVPTLSDEFTDLLLPVKLLEYVHMGLPVACSRLPCIERYFDAGALRFAEPGSPAALAEAIAGLCADPDAARAQAQRAGALLAGLRWEDQRRRYLALVDRLVLGAEASTAAPEPASVPAAVAA